MTNKTWSSGLITTKSIDKGQVLRYQATLPSRVIIYKLRDNNGSVQPSNIEFVQELSPKDNVFRAPVVTFSRHVQIHVDLREKSISVNVDFNSLDRQQGHATLRVNYRVTNHYDLLQHIDPIEILKEICERDIRVFIRQRSFQNIMEADLERIVEHIDTSRIGIHMIDVHIQDRMRWDGVAREVIEEANTGMLKRQLKAEKQREEAKAELESVKLDAERDKLQVEIEIEKNAHEMYYRVQFLRAAGINDPELILRAMAVNNNDLKVVLEGIENMRAEDARRIDEQFKFLQEALANKDIPDPARMKILKDLTERAAGTLGQSDTLPERPSAMRPDAFQPHQIQQNISPSLFSNPAQNSLLGSGYNQQNMLPNQQQTQLPPVQNQLGSDFVAYLMQVHPFQQTYQLLEPRTVIGRALEAQIQLQSPQISRQHAIVHYHDGVFWLENHGQIGTYVNQALVAQRVKLNPGDMIQIGNVQFQFGVQGGSSNYHGGTQVDTNNY